MQREDTTPLDKSKQERDLRNLYNFPDTPEIFTPQRKKPRKSEVKAVQARQEYDHKTYNADTFPIQPPLSPAQQLAPTPPRRYAPSKSPEPRTSVTAQSTSQRVAIGMYGNGAPRWGYVAKRTQGKEKAADPAQPTSSSMTSSSRSVMMTSPSSANVGSGSASSRKSTPATSTPRRLQSGSSASHGIHSISSNSTCLQRISGTPQCSQRISGANSRQQRISGTIAGSQRLRGIIRTPHASPSTSTTFRQTFCSRPHGPNTTTEGTRGTLQRPQGQIEPSARFRAGTSNPGDGLEKNKVIIDSGASKSGTGLKKSGTPFHCKT